MRNLVLFSVAVLLLWNAVAWAADATVYVDAVYR